MPTEANAVAYRNPQRATAVAVQQPVRRLPDGAGLALGVITGTALWGAILSFFFLL